MNRLRVANLNLWHDSYQREKRVSSLVKYINKYRIDVLLAQEIFEYKGDSVLNYLSKETDLNYSRESKQDSSTGILSLFPLREESFVSFPNPSLPYREFTFAGIERECHSIYFGSIHFAWGGGNELQRIHEAMALNAHVERVKKDIGYSATIIGGDFNTPANAQSIRYLKGLELIEGNSAYWSDATEKLKEPFITSTPNNRYALKTGSLIGFSYPENLPERGIDYQFAEGYAHAIVGGALEAKVCFKGGLFNPPPSDHYGLIVDYIC